jgi:hypothetical protein
MEEPMTYNKSLLTFAVATLATVTPSTAQTPASSDNSSAKEKVVIQTPEGMIVEVRVPKEIAKVEKTGPNTYEVTVDRDKAKKVEIKVREPKASDPR